MAELNMDLARNPLINAWLAAFARLRDEPLLALLISIIDAATLFLYGMISGFFGDLIAGEATAVGVILSESMRTSTPPGLLSTALSAPALPHTLLILAYIALFGILLAAAYIFLQGSAWRIAHGTRDAWTASIAAFARQNLPLLIAAGIWHTANVWLSLRASALEVVGSTQPSLQNWLLLLGAAAIAALLLLTASTGKTPRALRFATQQPGMLLGITLLALIVFLPWRALIGALQHTHPQAGLVIGIMTLLPLFTWCRFFLIDTTRKAR